MISERPWLLSCSNMEKLRRMYNNYTIAYRELIVNTFELWNNQLDTNNDKKMENNILVGNQIDQYWHLTINLDWY